MTLKALIEDLELNHEHCPKEVILKAAAELRRLHDLLGKANALCRIREDRIKELEAENEALQRIVFAFETKLAVRGYALEIADLVAENEALRADAGRYQWLRDTLHGAVGGGVEVNGEKLVYEEPNPGEAVRVFWYPVTPCGFCESKDDTLDAAIDAARGEK